MKELNKDLMINARAALKDNWTLAICGAALYLIATIGIQLIPKAGLIISMLVAGAMTVGLNTFMLSVSRERDIQLSSLMDGFSQYLITLGAYLLQCLFVFLWSLLLIVPGIIAAYSYSMTFYILADSDGEIGPMEAIRKSKKMMKGNKWKLCCLTFRFFGWALLCVLTLGIGFLWLFPYMSVSVAKFYDDIKFQESPVGVVA